MRNTGLAYWSLPRDPIVGFALEAVLRQVATDVHFADLFVIGVWGAKGGDQPKTEVEQLSICQQF